LQADQALRVSLPGVGGVGPAAAAARRYCRPA
jgi:hypothetical protein